MGSKKIAQNDDIDYKLINQLKKKEQKKKEKFKRLASLCEKMPLGTVVIKESKLSHYENPLHLTKGFKIGIIYGKHTSIGGMPQVWVTWYGTTIPVPEMPDLLQIIYKQASK